MTSFFSTQKNGAHLRKVPMVQVKKALQNGFLSHQLQALRETGRRNLAGVHGQVVTLEIAADDSMQEGLLNACFFRFSEEVFSKALGRKAPLPGISPVNLMG